MYGKDWNSKRKKRFSAVIFLHAGEGDGRDVCTPANSLMRRACHRILMVMLVLREMRLQARQNLVSCGGDAFSSFQRVELRLCHSCVAGVVPDRVQLRRVAIITA